MNIRKFIVTGLGAGYLRPPGTWGSLGPCLVYMASFYFLANRPEREPLDFGLLSVNAIQAALVLLSSIACVALGKFTEETFGKKDPGQCTIDEWAGQAVALLALPVTYGNFKLAAISVGVAFVMFRLFDITKPFPARRAEKLPLGWGVLVDDLVAGVYANIAAQFILRSEYIDRLLIGICT